MWRMRAWWLFIGLVAAALVVVVVIAVVTSSPSKSFGGPAPLPSGIGRPLAPYPTPHEAPHAGTGALVVRGVL